MTTEVSVYTVLEDEVINLLVIQQDFAIRLVDCIKPEYFSQPLNAAIAKIISAFVSRGIYLSRSALRLELLSLSTFPEATVDGKLEKIKPTQESAEYLSEKVIEFARRAAVKSAFLESIHIWKTGTAQQQDGILEKIKSALDLGARYDTRTLDFVTGLDALFDEQVEQPLFRTLLPTYDAYMDGGVHGGRLYCFAGRAKLGKSLCLAHVAIAAALQRQRVYVASWELDGRELMWRVAQRATHIPKNQLLSGQQKDKVAQWAKRFSANIKIGSYWSKTHSMNDVARDLEVLKHKEGFVPDVVILDYGTIMRGNIAHKQEYKDASQPYWDMKAYAMEHRIPIFTGAQINREGMLKERDDIATCVPRSEHLGSSIEIIQIVDYMIWLGTTDALWAKRQLAARLTSRVGVTSTENLLLGVNYETGQVRELETNVCGRCREVCGGTCFVS